MGNRFLTNMLSWIIVPFTFGIATANAQARDEKASDKVVQKFLESKEDESGPAESQGSTVADLDGDRKPEIVLVWVKHTANTWGYTLTVFTRTARGLIAVSRPLDEGFAKLASVKDGVILVDQTIYAESDPRCCPSIQKQGKYRWQGKKFTEVR
jgi:hypothetical protein